MDRLGGGDIRKMPLLYEDTDPVIRYHRKQLTTAVRKLSPGSGVTTFLVGLVTGFIILPIVLPIVGYQLTKRLGPPK